MSQLHHLFEKDPLRDSIMGKKLIIAGGGIGGLAAALALILSGFEVAVYERAPAFTEIGAGMSLWPNATRVLHSLGVLDEVLASGEPVTQFNLYLPDGKLISAIEMMGFQTPALCIHRADLHRASAPMRLCGDPEPPAWPCRRAESAPSGSGRTPES
jgi:flavin-dependent dehydrogenase